MKFSFSELEKKFYNLSYEQERKIKFFLLIFISTIFIIIFYIAIKYVAPLEEKRKLEYLKNIAELVE